MDHGFDVEPPGEVKYLDLDADGETPELKLPVVVRSKQASYMVTALRLSEQAKPLYDLVEGKLKSLSYLFNGNAPAYES